MKKMVKVAALIAAMALAAGLTACQGKGSSSGAVFTSEFVYSNGLIMKGPDVVSYTFDVPAKLSIPRGVASISGDGFEDCLKIESVTIPDTVTTIDESSFYGCKNLKAVTIGNGVTEIGNSAFEGCENLKSVNIPDSVTEIGMNAFNGCKNLKAVTMGNSVTEIGAYAFKDCDKLEVKYDGTKTQWEGIKKVNWRGEIGNFIVHCTDGDVTVKDKNAEE